LIFENESGAVSTAARKLIQEEGLADMGLIPRSLDPNNPELSGAVRGRLGLGPSVRWAVVDPKERCLASGQALPTAEGLERTLAAKGIQSPIRVHREFLKGSPDHLEARMDLLRLQLKSAERRTKAALGLETSESEEPSGAPGAQVARRRIQFSTATGGKLDEIFGSPKPKPIPSDKVVDTKQDLQIWGGYADTFDRLFSGDDWIAGGWSFDNADVSLEKCSPLVKALYRRKMKQVESALERAPLNPRLWSVWMRMADAVGGQSAQAVADRLARQPGGDFSSWPPTVRRRLIDEARTNNNWNYVTDYLWDEYQYRDSSGGPQIQFASNSSSPNPDRNDVLRQVMDGMQTREWDTLFEPLLEALLRMGDTGRADAVMDTLRERQGRGQWSEAQMHKAIALANRCGRQDVAKRWSLFLQEKSAK
jgi:hypothetical protein